MTKRFSKREQAIFVVMLIMVVGFMGYNGVIKPIQTEILLTEGQILKTQKKIRDNQKIIKKAKAFESEYEALKKKYKQSLPNEEINSRMSKDIRKVAGSLDLKISDMKPQKAIQREDYNQFLVSLRLESPLLEVVQFLYILQKEPHLFEVEEIRFDKAARRKSSSEDVKVTLVLSKFYIP